MNYLISLNPQLLFLLGAAFVLFVNSAMAQDIAGSKDHPLITRYPNSFIKKYERKEFDALDLLLSGVPYGDRSGAKTMHVEGKKTIIFYTVPPTPTPRSTLEVYRNYIGALESANFQTLFKCSNRECGELGWHLFRAVEPASIRHSSAKLSRREGDVYVALTVMEQKFSNGFLTVRLVVVEGKAMESGLVKVNAEAMAQEIAASGRIAIYGIYFDFNKWEIKPESEPTLNEIAKLLKQQPALKLLITGHTDNVGTMAYNLELSQRRAEAIVNSLVSRYGIEQRRLTPQGLGFKSPVATNKTEEGRAKNRRVELVEQ
jgi:OmpA-OmpF porin, OOP family